MQHIQPRSSHRCRELFVIPGAIATGVPIAEPKEPPVRESRHRIEIPQGRGVCGLQDSPVLPAFPRVKRLNHLQQAGDPRADARAITPATVGKSGRHLAAG